MAAEMSPRPITVNIPPTKEAPEKEGDWSGQTL